MISQVFSKSSLQSTSILPCILLFFKQFSACVIITILLFRKFSMSVLLHSDTASVYHHKHFMYAFPNRHTSFQQSRALVKLWIKNVRLSNTANGYSLSPVLRFMDRLLPFRLHSLVFISRICISIVLQHLPTRNTSAPAYCKRGCCLLAISHS